MLKYNSLLGKTIQIICLEGEGKDYVGRCGVVKEVAVDPWGDEYLKGTWGSLSVYPDIDIIKVIGGAYCA